GKTKYVRFSKTKRGLIPTILKLLIKQRKQAKKDRSRYDKSDIAYVNELTESHMNQGDSENLAITKTLAFIEKNYNYYNILQDVLKRIANSIYGQFSNQYSIICDYEVSASVTAFARNYITMATEYMKNKEISESIKEKKFIWKYTNTDSIFFSLSPILINEIIKKYEFRLLDKNVNEEDFSKIIYDIRKEIVLVLYEEGINLQNEINGWMANKMESPYIVMEMEKVISSNLYISKKKYNGLIYDKPEYYYDNEWKGLDNHIKEVLKVDNVTKEMIDEYIKTANEYTLLSHGRKFDNLLAKGTDLVRRNAILITRVILKKLLYTIFDYKEYSKYLYNKKFTKIEEYQNFINFNEDEWCRDISKKIVEDFIKYLYSKETELELELFEQNARNNEEEDNGEMTFIELTNHRCFKYNNQGKWEIVNNKIVLYDEKGNLIDFSRNRENQKGWERSDRDYIYLQKDELKEDGSVIEYKEVELKQVSDEDTTSYVKKFVADMKLIGVE
ncbi:21516_t:CDS:1, partial [Cetraspora pellucida]